MNKLTSTNYTQINSSITELMRTGTFSGVAMTVYTDEALTTIAIGPNGTPIEKRKVISVNTTNSYTDANGVLINPSLIVMFADKTEIKSIDTVDNYWFSVEGIVLKKKTF